MLEQLFCYLKDDEKSRLQQLLPEIHAVSAGCAFLHYGEVMAV